MGRPSKFLRKSINFGQVGHKARHIVEEYEKENGGQQLSKWIRNLVVWMHENDEKHKEWRVKMLEGRHRSLGSDIAILVNERERVRKDLKDLGRDWEDLE